MAQISDFTLIGSGIISLLTAKELINEGCSVTIVDKSLSGKESSWAGGGILFPLYPWRQSEAISALVIESIKRYAALSSELVLDTQIDPEWNDCGLLICKNPDIKLAIEWCQKNNIPYFPADQKYLTDLNALELNPLWLPTIAQIRNPRLLRALKADLIKAGVEFIENNEVVDVNVTGDKITHLVTDKGGLNVNEVIINTGAWSGVLIKKLFSEKICVPEIFPVKGQMLLYKAKPETLSHMVLDGDRYLIPRQDGSILVGSSVEHCGFDKSISKGTKNSLVEFATEILPVLKKFAVAEQWAGLRPGTKQGVPLYM